jgi:zinc transport system substrate-binding protein
MKTLLLVFTLLCNFVCSQTQYITTIYPLKAIISPLVSSSTEVDVILPPGASPHTYGLRPSDLEKVAAAGIFFQGGKNLDTWALKIPHPQRIELLNLLPQELFLYFSQIQLADQELEKDHHDHMHGGIDPHFWTDPLAVKALLPALVDSLCTLYPKDCPDYSKNQLIFSAQLDSLSDVIKEKLAPIAGKSVMLSHPFFCYYLNRFAIKLAGVIQPIPGKEPTPGDLKKLIQIIKTEKVSAILSHPQLSDRAAQLVAEATNIRVFELDPLGGLKGRKNYQELLLYNTQILLEALD